MNNVLLSKAQSYLQVQGIGIKAAVSFAPGVIGVHDTYGHAGELNIFFDSKHWSVKGQQLWKPNAQMYAEGLGIISSKSTTEVIADLSALFYHAQLTLQASARDLVWYVEPQNISPAELGGMTMVSPTTGSEAASIEAVLSQLDPRLRRMSRAVRRSGIIQQAGRLLSSLLRPSRGLQHESRPGSIEKSGVSLKINAPSIFTPTQRTAILVNGKDIDVERMKPVFLATSTGTDVVDDLDYRPFDMVMLGNKALCSLEEAFTGQVNIPEYITRRMDLDHIRIIADSISRDSKGYHALAARCRSKDMLNTRLLKITPDMNMREALRSAIAKVAGDAGTGHLLSMYIYAHGSHDGFEIGLNDFMSYAQLFDLLDTVPGKKFVLLCACHSGNLVDFAKRHKSKDDYAVITSTDGEPTTNWNDDEFQPLIAHAVARGAALSEIVLRPTLVHGYAHRPQRYLGFDVRP